jgi:predicted amidophosphoribosyltransferase
MIRKFFLFFIDFLFPIHCSFCGRFDFFSSKLSICKKCCKERGKEQVTAPKGSVCEICATEIIHEDCTYCNSRNVFFSKLYYIRIRGDIEREIIQKVKFGNAPYLSNYFRLGLRKFLSSLKERNYTAIVNIPSNKKTIRNRPIPVCKSVINFLAKQLQIDTIIPFIKKSNELQSGKSFRDRFLHAQSAFAIKKSHAKKNSGNYLLVDDVFTTGATINEIAKLLIINGAKEVDVLVLVKGQV